MLMKEILVPSAVSVSLGKTGLACTVYPQLLHYRSSSVPNRPHSNYDLVPANNNLKLRLRARKYSKCMKLGTKPQFQVTVRGN